MLKAESILKDDIPICKELSTLASKLKPGQYITWPVYYGDDILDAKKIEDYVNGFFKTGTIIPIPVLNLGLNVYAVQAEYDDGHSTHKVVIEGFITKIKE